MSLMFNNNSPKEIKYNGNDVKKIIYNGVQVWKKRLPHEYQEVEYIQSDGDQYLNLLRVPNMNDIFEQKFMTLNTTRAVRPWYGSMPNSSKTTPRISMGISSVGIFVGANSTVGVSELNQDVHTVIWQYKEDAYVTYTLDDEEEQTKRNTSGTSSYTPAVTLTSYLFARHGNSGVQATDGDGTRIYYHREYLADGTPQLDLVPCYRKSDGEIGMYDLINGTFFANLGTGTFDKGNDV